MSCGSNGPTACRRRSTSRAPIRTCSRCSSSRAPAPSFIRGTARTSGSSPISCGRAHLACPWESWETANLDQLRLLAVAHPDSVEVFVDERFPPSSASDQLHLLPVIRRRPPLSAVDEQGRDVLAELRDHDFRYVSDLTPLGYQGLTKPHALILDLDAAAGAPGTVLMLRGWIFP